MFAVGCTAIHELVYNDLEREMVSVDNKNLKNKK